MTPQTEFMETLVATAEEHCNLDSAISLDELSDSNSLYAELGEAFVQTTYYDKSTVRTIPVLFLCRNKDQRRCMEQLESICDYFQRLKQCPQGELFRWMDAEIAKGASKIGRDEDGTYHYSCILNVKLFY